MIDELGFSAKSQRNDMEQWRDIPGFEGLYQVSNYGNVRTCLNKTTSNAKFKKRVWKQRVLRQVLTKRRGCGKRDARVSLWKDGKHGKWLVSRLVAMAWCDGYAEGLTVNHIDGNPENNFASNLEWVTYADNIRKGFETGLFATSLRPVVLVDENNNTYRFRSMSAASLFLGKNHGYVSGMCAKSKYKLPSGFTIQME